MFGVKHFIKISVIYHTHSCLPILYINGNLRCLTLIYTKVFKIALKYQILSGKSTSTYKYWEIHMQTFFLFFLRLEYLFQTKKKIKNVDICPILGLGYLLFREDVWLLLNISVLRLDGEKDGILLIRSTHEQLVASQKRLQLVH